MLLLFLLAWWDPGFPLLAPLFPPGHRMVDLVITVKAAPCGQQLAGIVVAARTEKTAAGAVVVGQTVTAVADIVVVELTARAAAQMAVIVHIHLARKATMVTS